MDTQLLARLNSIDNRLGEVEKSLPIINRELGSLISGMNMTVILVKYVILPLILIVGGLVGIKLFM